MLKVWAMGVGTAVAGEMVEARPLEAGAMVAVLVVVALVGAKVVGVVGTEVVGAVEGAKVVAAAEVAVEVPMGAVTVSSCTPYKASVKTLTQEAEQCEAFQ